ncbi:glutamate-rich WD repeat-containing protein 1 isoform X2 [Ctenocephalides felis]|uniref:glutamate-rich WD repeat-containing protein 1 isoform X2 n=1 Tax=Ctenocephalides felis TaxID=7515 RepID=UPI000E6E282C|nr:glutamate-rich WD repeat-containing protein 1 isoform X2 [Ctenocephalides felis]
MSCNNKINHMDNEMSMDVEDETSSEEEHSDNEGMEDSNEQENDGRPDVYLPGQPLKEGEELVCDESAYIMLHQAQTGAPCLSFDIINDQLGNKRETFPLTCYLAAGTQAAKTHVNSLIVMKLHNLHRTSKKENDDDDDEESDESDNEEAETPKMDFATIKHQGCVNRIRTTAVSEGTVLAATWSELGRVNIWDLTKQLATVDDQQMLSKYNKENTGNTCTPIFTFNGHQQEGYAVDWSKTAPGVLATGDCRKDIHIWTPAEGGTFNVDQRPLVGHTASVEDLQWSPNERSVLASCSVDRSIRIWDTRAAPTKACMLTATDAHQNDINVINWNKNEPFICSGGDDGCVHIWDLRQFKDGKPLATFKHHTQPVTTVEWHPTDSSVFASGGADNQIALWDLSVEKDTEAEDETDMSDVPPQLLFIHQGQTDIKELHWHPQIPGVILSTALSGFNIFRTISV